MLMAGCFLVLAPLRAAETLPLLTLLEIEAALFAHPPTLAASAPRAKIAASLDQLVNVRVQDKMTDEERARLKPLTDFYRRQVDRGLDALEKIPVTEGVRARAQQVCAPAKRG